MKFRIFVDPPSALRAGNERIREQFVDVDLSELSEEQREIVSASHLVPQPACVDLTRRPNGTPIAHLAELKLASADKSAVLAIIHARLDAQTERKRLDEFAEAHFEAALGPKIAKYEPAFRDFFVTPREEELVEEWMQENYPQELKLSKEDEKARPEETKRHGTLVSNISHLVHVTIGGQDRFDSHRTDGWMDIDTAALPDDEAGIRHLRQVASKLMGAPARQDWLHTQWMNRRAALEKAFMAELVSKRPAIEALIEKARVARAMLKQNAATVTRIVKTADANNPDQQILERFREGVLPETELLGLLRSVAFAPLDGTPRFKRIADSEVKRRRNQDVIYNVITNTAVKAKHFQLAKELQAKLPDAKVSQVTHLALVENERKVERDAVRVTVQFAGHVLSREYVPS